MSALQHYALFCDAPGCLSPAVSGLPLQCWCVAGWDLCAGEEL